MRNAQDNPDDGDDSDGDDSDDDLDYGNDQDDDPDDVLDITDYDIEYRVNATEKLGLNGTIPASLQPLKSPA